MAPPSIPDVLAGKSVLVTGGAGFIGLGLLYRLVDPSLAVKRAYIIIRGHGRDPLTRIPPDLLPHVARVDASGKLPDGPVLVVLDGDCCLPNLGLEERERKWIESVEIVIHTAGDTRFRLSLPQATKAISDLAYAMCLFTLGNLNVRTHIHLSTCFTGWFLPSGSTVYEELVPPIDPTIEYEEHANTYLHAKSIAEGIVNAIGRTQAGRPMARIAWRIVRLSTVGPAISYPVPGWGAGHTSSPVSGAIAAMVGDDALYVPGAELDVVPVDIAVNQILALTAATHTHVRNPFTPLSHGANVPIYNIAAGTKPNASIPMPLLNNPLVKLKDPYVPVKNLLAAYKPMMSKIVTFDTRRTWTVLGLSIEEGKENGIGTKKRKYQNGTHAHVNGNGHANHAKVNGNHRCTSSAFGLTVPVTDPPIDTVGYEVDVAEAVERCGGWMRYLQLVRDKMEETREEDESFEAHVD